MSRATDELIPRRVLFGNPDRASPRLSPDGRFLTFLAPREGVLNLWIAERDKPLDARPLTNDQHRGITNHVWAFNNRDVLFLQDESGDENWRLRAVNVESGEMRDLTPFEGVQVRIQDVHPSRPDSILIAMNQRHPERHDVYEIDLDSGRLTLVEANDRGFLSFVADTQFRVRFGMLPRPDGGMEMLRREDDGAYTPFLSVPAADNLTTGPFGLDESGARLFLIDSRDRDTSVLVSMDLHKGKTQVLAADPRADVEEPLVHPRTGEVQAASFNYERREWRVLDPALEGDFARMKTFDDGEPLVISRTLDDAHWLVSYARDDGPTRYYHYDRSQGAARLLFTSNTALESQPLARMRPLTLRSRDGLPLVSYLTLPRGSAPDESVRPTKPLPMVLLVHGGPWYRDSWGYDSDTQWLANRGYAVMSVNFRGSTGFGKNFINAGDREWAGKMHDDLIDAVDWAIAEGIADPAKVAIMGGSYGGYAALVGLTFTPDRFACAIDIVGPSNLHTLLDSIPPYWKPLFEVFATRVGDPRTDAGRALLAERSPLSRVDRIRRPLLIGQGANDPRVKQAEAEQIVAAMSKRRIPVTYLLYPDEGHGFVRPENRLSFFAVAEAFLAEHLGGRSEPLGEDFDGSSVQCPHGAEFIPALRSARWPAP